MSEHDEKPKFLGYIRGKAELRQRRQILLKAGAEGFTITGWYTDLFGSVGRPQLDQALAELREGKAKGLIVVDVTRVTRDVAELRALLQRAAAEGWQLVIAGEG